MSDQIGNNGQGGGVSGGYGFLTPATGAAGSHATPFLNDSMSISEFLTHQSNDMADPSNPRLRQPTYTDVMMQFQLGMAQIVCEMLTNWNKTIQEEGERVRVEMNSPAYRTWVELHSTKYIVEEDLKAGTDLKKASKSAYEQQAALTTGSLEQRDRYLGLEERYYQLAGLSSLISLTVHNAEATSSSRSNSENSSINPTRSAAGADHGAYSPASTMATSLAIGAGFISAFSQVPDVASSSQIEVRTIQDAWNNINTNNDLLSQNGGWFSAMWGVGLVYQLSAQNIAELGAGYQKGPHKDLEFAKGYAQSLINSLEGNAFNITLMALLTPMIEKSPEAKAQASPEVLALKGKLVLLALALALVYKLELKSQDPNAKIDESTFAAMLKGTINFSRDDKFETAELKRQLVFYFQFNLQALPEAERVKVIEGILAYVTRETSQEEPGVEGLLDQQKAFSDILAEGTFEQSLVDKKPI